MFDYLLALLRALIDSLFTLFSRAPALEILREWFGGTFTRFGSVAGFLLLSAAVLLGALAAVGFLWLLRRHPGRGQRARILAEVLPFEAPEGDRAAHARREEGHVG